ncbi:Thioredoxin-like fold protein [Hirsutella rhossiliensis]|uniref:Thioredoxin-like fold protein n=1 Tax=Hirsutella rhossiliensis TaxID=111463 RepID=A0A9P8SGI7_9HYPO|nr:Thioredoxin-like fold protein [Hirsutella rhossiliensis]KAH0960530.1 Thioredoxin-like fold protein [Hirsutella rhossiliensis]
MRPELGLANGRRVHNVKQSAASTESGTQSGFWAELESLKTPTAKDVASAPKIGDQAPSTTLLNPPDGRKTIVLFLRHFAEKTFKTLATFSEKHKDAHCVAVSQSSAQATERWVPQVGGAWNTGIVDEGRDLYAKPSIWNRPTESRTRWQTSGAFAIDETGIVRWAHVSKAADDMPNFDAALVALGLNPNEST